MKTLSILCLSCVASATLISLWAIATKQPTSQLTPTEKAIAACLVLPAIGAAAASSFYLVRENMR